MGRISNAISTACHRIRHPLHIEFNLTDYCNLNCKGCSHYSPLAPADYETLESLDFSMKRISEAKNSRWIKAVFLIGGETLLYHDLNKAMEMARRYFPWARISVFTNGLMLPKMSEEFWDKCRKLDVVMAITRYPIRFDYDKVEELCREKGVEVEIFGDRGMADSFFRLPLDPEKKQNKWLSHFRCCSYGCITVDRGRIFPCSMSACVKHLNSRFGTDFTWEKGDYIEVSELKDVREIKRLRNFPVPFCGYCRRQETTEFGPSRREKSEWM